jgi:hypothetical protein
MIIISEGTHGHLKSTVISLFLFFVCYLTTLSVSRLHSIDIEIISDVEQMVGEK